MILIDTSLYIEAVAERSVEQLLQQLADKAFIQSCDVIEKEIAAASEFLRTAQRREDAEKLKLIYTTIPEGTIRTSDRITTLAEAYHKEAIVLSRMQHKEIANDFLIVASAAVAGVKTILSFNRKTMASAPMVNVYRIVNTKNKYPTPAFVTTMENLRRFLQSL